MVVFGLLSAALGRSKHAILSLKELQIDKRTVRMTFDLREVIKRQKGSTRKYPKNVFSMSCLINQSQTGLIITSDVASKYGSAPGGTGWVSGDLR